MRKSSLCDYSDAYILLLVSGTIPITRAGSYANARQRDEINKGVISKYFAPFTDCISEIDNTLGDNAKSLDVVMSMYSNSYSKTSGNLWKYYEDA